MIKNLKPSSDKALINHELIRDILIKLDSDILRGSNTILILDIIADLEPNGAYGYQIKQILNEKSKYSIIFEEATLYTLLKKLLKNKMISEEKVEKRKYFRLTPLGWTIYNYSIGYFSQIAETLIDFKREEYSLENMVIFCPNCSNRIHVDKTPPRFCRICGSYVENIIVDLLRARNLPFNSYKFADYSTDLMKIEKALKF
ncbi:MAG: PadR family transcriptional regulator [Promethearchaeota archaeon]